MERRQIYKIITTILLISLALLAMDVSVAVHAKSYSFTATISPAEVDINQLAPYSINITNTGDSTLGSTSITIPEGFTVLSPITILNPPSTWNYTLSITAISLTATSGGAVLPRGGSVIFTFDAISPHSSSVTTWTAEATTSIEGGGGKLTLEGEQPTVTVISLYFAPTISASPDTINQNQFSLLSQLTGTSGGTLPYTYQWLEAYNGGTFSVIAGANGPDHTFSTTESTATGTWSFKLNVTDNSTVPATITSNVINVIVNPELTAPEVTATPNTISQTEPSTLTSTPVATGTSPYTYQWFQKAPGGDYTTVGDNSASYTFPGTTTTGTWTFLLQVTDNTGASLNSSTVDVTVSSTPVFTLIVTQTAHGTINPGTTSVTLGGNQSFTISPDIGYEIADVLVNGISVGAVTSFVFVDVTADHNLTATFAQIEYTLTVSVVGNGSVALSPSRETYHYGDVVQLTAIPASGCRFSVWTGALTGSLNQSSITINGNKAVTATFLTNQYTITAIAGLGGSINPPETIIVDYGGSQAYTITPSVGYHIADVSVDGISVGVVTSYTFTQVVADHSIAANFSISADYYFINVASSHGSPTHSAQVKAGESFTASVTSPEGDAIHQWVCVGYSMDGGAFVSGTSYTFINVQVNHTITFNWQEQYHLTVISSGGSTTGTGWYNAGATATVSVSSNAITSDSGIRQIFTGWIGDATGADTTSNPIIIDGPKTATATWKTQCRVTYAASGNVLQVTVPPTEWVDEGTQSIETFPTSVANSAGNTKIVFVSDNRSTVITEPITVTGTYRTQYLVTFMQNGIASDASGTVVTILGETRTYEQFPNGAWIDAGGSITFSYAATVETMETDKQYILTSTNFPSPLTISGPTTIQGYYQLQINSSDFTLGTIALIAILLSIPPSLTIPLLARRRKRRKKITPIAKEGGSISPSTVQTIERGGDSIVFIITAHAGYRIADLVIDNTVHLGDLRTYKFVNVTKDHTISATFCKE